MGTSFDVIYSRFLQKIEDYRLTELDDADIDKMMFGWLLSAIAQIRELKVSGFTFNDTDTAFSYKLSNLEIEVLALGMVQEWLEPQLESVLLTRQFVSSKEEQLEIVRCIRKRCSVSARICWKTLRAITPQRKDEICLIVMA